MASRIDPAPESALIVTVIFAADKFIAENKNAIKNTVNFFIKSMLK